MSPNAAILPVLVRSVVAKSMQSLVVENQKDKSRKRKISYGVAVAGHDTLQ
ncbi:MAG: hypothetical protein HC797_01220 [Anaerolineales bacterium]|nr:hypothetical protein [Anaerolineales bacterium]